MKKNKEICKDEVIDRFLAEKRVFYYYMVVEVLRNKWFWLSVIILFVLAVILEVYLLFGVVLKSMLTTSWPPMLLVMGCVSIVLGAIGDKKKQWESKAFRQLGTILFILTIIWTIILYGVIKGFLTITGMVFLTKIVGLFVPRKK